ncbi:ABC transporter permease [Anaerocolumna chitinilytica]|uniref:Transport permease protein n=1 Tax=Anaerocolumna chitinilytica TaxID=1727145 RepID=A0A7I8DJ63_9FIRM|nr:ABC transporter permease [Anaerocolumna chitinilytica]BCJ97035.1 transport permease protein [Anaerocolumna chitinilytica]
MISLAKRVIRQILGDKRTMGLMLFAPLLILTLIYLLLGNSSYTPTIAINEQKLPEAFVTALKEENTVILNTTEADSDPKAYLKENTDVDAFLSMSKTGTTITMYEASSKSGKAMKAIQSALEALNPAMKLDTGYVYGGDEDSTFQTMGYIFLGVIAFFFIFIISGMALVRERNSGTLERMLMTPIQRRSIIGGYTIGYGIFAIIQTIILVLFSIYVLGLSSNGNVLWVILIMLLLAVAAVSLGEFISIFASSEFQVVQFIPIIIIPQIFFSGLIPLDTLPYHLGVLSYIMPLFYGCSAIKKVMVYGNGLSDIYYFLLALLFYIVVLSSFNTLVLKKYRKL